jgi:TorA maturation chaperone TorD
MAAPLREFTHGTFDADAALAQISDEEFNQTFVASMRLLGTLFVASPKTQDFKRALEAVRSLDLGQDWPFGGEGDLARAAELFRQGAAEEDDEELLRSYQRLFRGPNSLPAPPWGSVYMDRDQVMYGWTWNELKAWMRSNGVEGTYEENDPEDHIGRLMLMAATVPRSGPRASASCWPTTCCAGATTSWPTSASAPPPPPIWESPRCRARRCWTFRRSWASSPPRASSSASAR